MVRHNFQTEQKVQFFFPFSLSESALKYLYTKKKVLHAGILTHLSTSGCLDVRRTEFATFRAS